MSPALPRLTQGGRFSGSSCSSSRNLILTKVFQAYAFPIWRYAPERGHSQCIYMRGEIHAFKSAGCVFMLLYITLHSPYLCRLFTFIGPNLSFGRQLCLPAHVCSHVLCSALSYPWAGESLLPVIPCTQPSWEGTSNCSTPHSLVPLFPAVLCIPFVGILSAIEQPEHVTP